MSDRLIITNIKRLYTPYLKPPVKGPDMDKIHQFDNAYLVIHNGLIEAFGSGDFSDYLSPSTTLFDALGTILVPGFVDSHTHLVHAGSRENEFQKKIQGVPYLDILKQGGGILSTVQATRSCSIDSLLLQSKTSLERMLSYGVTTLETKSGYGLDIETERKQLQVARMLSSVTPITIVSTYMGAHAVPEDYRHRKADYIDQVIQNLSRFKTEGLADAVDVFCESSVFSLEESRHILEAAKSLGYPLHVHADEIDPIGGTGLAVSLGAASADHLMAVSLEDISRLGKSNTVANLLPGTSFFLNQPFAKARTMLENHVAIAVSSDYNPGSSPSENFQLILQLAANKLRMTPNEILNAATINPAFLLGLSASIGSIEIGKAADFVLLDAPNFEYVLYHYGINHTRFVWKNGRCVYSLQ